MILKKAEILKFDHCNMIVLENDPEFMIYLL